MRERACTLLGSGDPAPEAEPPALAGSSPHRAPPPCSAPLPLRKEVEGCVVWCVAQPCIACRRGLLRRWTLEACLCFLCREVCLGSL